MKAAARKRQRVTSNRPGAVDPDIEAARFLVAHDRDAAKVPLFWQHLVLGESAIGAGAFDVAALELSRALNRINTVPPDQIDFCRSLVVFDLNTLSEAITKGTRKRPTIELVGTDRVALNMVVGESKAADYTVDAPPSSPADASREGMRDDFNTQIKQAKAEHLARAKSRPAAHQLATYRALRETVDLLNPDLSEAEGKRRAKQLVQAYERLRDRRPGFHDKGNRQLLAAFSIMNKVKYRRGQAKKAAQKAALAM
jgi:hypothetical protein